MGGCVACFIDKYILECFLVFGRSLIDGLCGLLEVHISAAERVISVGKVKVHAEGQGVKLLHDNEVSFVSSLCPVEGIRIKKRCRSFLDDVLYFVKVVLFSIILILFVYCEGVKVICSVWD